MEAQKRRQEDVEAVSEPDEVVGEQDRDPCERDPGKELEAAAQ